MPGVHDYGFFVAACVLLNLVPGQDTLYILGRSIGEGPRAGVASALGISAGCIVHTLAAALGLSALIATSATAFTVVKLMGAAYLVVLGLRALFAKTPPGGRVASRNANGNARAFRQGLVTNVLNPKVALFFLAFLPQFIDAASPVKIPAFLFLGLTFVATGTLWCLVLALAAARVRGLLTRHGYAQTAFMRLTGVLFVGLGVRLALAER